MMLTSRPPKRPALCQPNSRSMTIPIATMNVADIWNDQRLVLIFT
jgi:hypothetical protein